MVSSPIGLLSTGWYMLMLMDWMNEENNQTHKCPNLHSTKRSEKGHRIVNYPQKIQNPDSTYEAMLLS
jgi:hypothetical protein